MINFKKASIFISILTLNINNIKCIHVEHEPYEEVEKYYQYGYQVDDHYTGEIWITILSTFVKHYPSGLLIR